MEDIFDKEENAKNIYVIRHKLADLKEDAYYGSNIYSMTIGPYLIVMRPSRSILSGVEVVAKYPNLLGYEKIDVSLYEKDNHHLISLRENPIFKSYKPIQYNTFEGPNGTINFSDGHDMPILHLCELIKYLIRLSNLTAFS